jgi:hypothetical protein
MIISNSKLHSIVILCLFTPQLAALQERMSVETAELRQLVGNRASVPKVIHAYKLSDHYHLLLNHLK